MQQGGKGGRGGSDDATVVTEAGLVGMQAEDFGFGIGEDQESDNSEDSAEPKPVGSAAGSPEKAQGTSPEKLGSPGAARPGSATSDSRTYGDRLEGMSMQERLANLEFSDCEDEDDNDAFAANKPNAG